MREDSTAVTAAEGSALAEVLREVSADEWQVRTDCGEWTVRDLTAHLVGQAEALVNPVVLLRRRRLGARRYPDRTVLDACAAVAVDGHAKQSGPELAEEFARLWPRAVATMRRTPAIARRLTADSGVPEYGKISLGRFHDRVMPRALLVQRIELSRALGRPMTWHGHERRIVNAVMRDLASAWTGPAVTLSLTGDAGGVWHLGSGPATAQVTAEVVEYQRTLAGCNPSPELSLTSGRTAALTALTEARVIL